ncbi:MAG: antitoxin family protein [candidate division NC10 bacterium]|nr:antitoxin family protein [candidate division NC10 bacterium]
MPHFIRAIYEDGVLKPTRRLKLKERAWCLISLYPEAEWKEEFNTLLRRIHTRTKRYPFAEIERDITAARAEVRANRREGRRPR